MSRILLATAALFTFAPGCAQERATVAFARVEVAAVPIEVLRVASDHLNASGYHVRLHQGALSGERTDWTFWSPGVHIIGAILTPVFVLTLPVGAMLGGGPYYMMAGYAIARSADIDRQVRIDFESCHGNISVFQMHSRTDDKSSKDELQSLADAILCRFPFGTFEFTDPPTYSTH